jgi:VWFA-related protein
MASRFIAALALGTVSAVVLSAQQAAPPAPQEQPPIIFRVEVNFVEIDAVVTDANGNVVTDLTRDDFEVLEDGRPQTIETFSMVNLPVEQPERPLFAEAPIEPDVQDNVGAEGRIYLFVLDDLHTTFEETPRVKAAARTFVERYFGANDLGAVIYISGRADAAQDFTRSRRLLLGAIDRFTSRKPTSLLPMDERERAFNARTMMSSLRKQTDFMAGVRGRRKAVLLFSEGIDFNVFSTAPALGIRGVDSPPVSTAILTAASATIVEESRLTVASATRGNVVIYAIDSRGLATPSDNQAVTADGDLAPLALGAEQENVPAPTGVGPGMQQLQLAQDSLRTLAANTGGFAAVNRNRFDAVFDRIVNENSTYYIMGYYPVDERREGRFRRVEVRVKRPGLTVRTRSGYIEPRGRPASTSTSAAATDPVRAAANDAVASPLPVTGLPLRVFAAPIRGTAPNASVALVVDIDTRPFQFVERDGQLASRVDMTFAVTDHDAKVRATNTHTATLRFRPEALEAARASGFRFTSAFEVPPGRYQVRVAAATEGGQRGSAIYDLEVPDFTREAVSMSGLAITSAAAARAPTARGNDPLRELLPGPPVTNRVFDRQDVVTVFAEFYENMRDAPPHQFEINTTLSVEGGRVVFEDFDTRSSAELQGATGGFGHRVDIPLSLYEPGLYVLRVSGRSGVGNLPAVAREVLIRIQ